MQARELVIPNAFEFRPQLFPDSRGVFGAPFQEPAFVKAVGYSMRVAQSNHSVSRQGTIRGVHFADVPPGQAKYVYCPQGALLDVVVDLRDGSPTFGRWDAVRLDSSMLNALYIPEGLGHAFIALEDETIMSYLCSTGYNPVGEHGVNPLDPRLGLPWPAEVEPIRPDKDAAAPTLTQARAAGILPRHADCLVHYKELHESQS